MKFPRTAAIGRQIIGVHRIAVGRVVFRLPKCVSGRRLKIGSATSAMITFAVKRGSITALYITHVDKNGSFLCNYRLLIVIFPMFGKEIKYFPIILLMQLLSNDIKHKNVRQHKAGQYTRSNVKYTNLPGNNLAEQRRKCVFAQNVVHKATVIMDGTLIFYSFVFPIIFLFGIPANIVASLKLRTKAAKEPSYIYLLTQCLNCVICLTWCTMWMGMYYWTGVMLNQGPHWMMSNGLIMYAATFVIDPTCNIFITASVSLTLVGCIDRIVAIKKPVIYKTVEKKKWILGSVAVIYLIAVALTIPDAFRMNVSFNETLNEYRVYEDKAYTSGLGPKLLISARSFARIIMVFLILVLNVSIWNGFLAYRRAGKRLMESLNSEAVRSNVAEQNLALTLFVQSLLVSLGQISMSVEYVMLYFDLSGDSRWYLDTLSNLAFLSEMAVNPLDFVESSIMNLTIKIFFILCTLTIFGDAVKRCVWGRGRLICKKDIFLHCRVPVELVDHDPLKDDLMGTNITSYDGHFLIYGCGADLISPPDPYIRVKTKCNSKVEKILKSKVIRTFAPNVADFGDIFLDSY
uniref:Uncharacterized protein n=1 Tax=Romanomermis culicivorax TaxID=13658 RepID=A0A915JD19_ROMCU